MWTKSPAVDGPSRPRVVRRRPGFGGTLFAVLAFCLSLTPSLLPRVWYLAGLIGGITAVLGYGLGAFLGWVSYSFFRLRFTPSDRARRIAWRVLIVGSVALSLFFLWRSHEWQKSLRVLLGMEPTVSVAPLRITGVAVAVFFVLLGIARAVRLATRTLDRFLMRFIPRPIAYVVGFAVAVFATVGFAQGFLWNAFISVANSTASLGDEDTPEGVHQPTSNLRSGGPESLVSWDSLGYQGRAFTGAGTTVEALTAFSGKPAVQPVRVYAGLKSAEDTRARADLVVRELERTHAFERPVVAVFGTTGTGWIDRDMADSLEFLYGGNTAMVGLQYSYLPSWISFLTDKEKAAEAGRDTVAAVRARIDQIPADKRPKLFVGGESLGAFGSESAFPTVDSMTQISDGTLLMGPPNASPLWRKIIQGRDKGSTEWHPFYEQGRRIRFAQEPAQLHQPGPDWQSPRVVYLQNATDPIVWWDWELAYKEPDWLNAPRSPFIAKDMNWYPMVTFWQVVVDLVFALDAPKGQGHRYGSNAVDGWVAVAQPPGWTEQDTARLKAFLDGRKGGATAA